MSHDSSLRSDRGSALLLTILLLLIISGLAAAMVTSSTTDTMVTRNHESQAQAQATGEAGLNHAVDVSRTYLRNWEAGFTNTNDAVSRVLRGPDDVALNADDGSLAWLAGGTPTPPAVLGLAGLPGVSYSARVFDDDDPALGNNWTAADLTRLGEGNAGVADPAVDHNGVYVVRATGFARDSTVVTVESVMKPCPWPAIITNGDLDLSGGPSILGDGGSVHANGDITQVGNSAVVQHDVTAVGTVSTNPGWAPVQGLAEGGQLPIPIPAVNVADYLALAKYRLGGDGAIYYAPTNVLICANDAACKALGFTVLSQAGSQVSHMAGITRTWDYNGTPTCAMLDAALTARGVPNPNCGQGVYHAQASDVKITGNIGRMGLPSPYALTLLVEGSISISGTPHLVPAVSLPSILIITNGDIEMSGTANCILAGQSRAREQLSLGGTMALTGQILAENRWDIADPVHGDSKVYGSAVVTNDRLAVYDFALAGWREFRR